MAAEMETSRAQLNRVLDPEASNVTLDTLSRAARVLGHSLKVELV
jgi:antitoxin HicB